MNLRKHDGQASVASSRKALQANNQALPCQTARYSYCYGYGYGCEDSLAGEMRLWAKGRREGMAAARPALRCVALPCVALCGGPPILLASGSRTVRSYGQHQQLRQTHQTHQFRPSQCKEPGRPTPVEDQRPIITSHSSPYPAAKFAAELCFGREGSCWVQLRPASPPTSTATAPHRACGHVGFGLPMDRVGSSRVKSSPDRAALRQCPASLPQSHPILSHPNLSPV